MRTLSLDLRGLAANEALPKETSARGAGASVAVHVVGIGALLLVPLLGSSDLPKAAGATREILIAPIRVALPSPPVLHTQAQTAPTTRPPAFQAPVDPAPTDTRVMLNAADVLDPSTPSDSGEPGDNRNGVGQGGDCPVGTLCGDVALPTATPLPALVHVGGLIREPRLAAGRPPQYPALAQAARVSGKVSIEAHVGRDGRIQEAHVVEGHTLFDEAALSSVRSRRYEPLLLNGEPTEFLVTITVVFTLRN